MVKRSILFCAAVLTAAVMLCHFGITDAGASEPAALFPDKTTEEVIETARKGLGVPYAWGGTSASTGWDCSGYVTWVGKKLGVDMGRTTDDILSYGRSKDAQAATGSSAADFNRDYGAGIIKEGDIVVFFNKSGNTVHTGIVGGDYSIYHAWGEGASAYWFKPANSSWCEGTGTVHCRFDKMWEVDGGHEKSYVSYVVFRGVEDKGFAMLMKSSANTSITVGNDCYSLKGAVYGVYSDSGCTKKVGSLTTDAKGNSKTLELKVGTYYVKELEAPLGFKLDKEIYSVEVTAKKTAELEVTDEPKYNTLELSLQKIDMETGELSQGKSSLSGAEFTIKYYDNTTGKAAGTPKKTWVIQTKAENGKYYARLNDSYKVGGGDFYTVNAKAVLPLGTYSIEETKAPAGYQLKGALIYPKGSEGKGSGRYTAVVSEEGQKAVLSGGNVFTAADKVIRGGVKIRKRDYETKKAGPQGGATLEGAVFEIAAMSDAPIFINGKTYKKGEAVTTMKTDKEGIAQTTSTMLPYGSYQIREVSAPAGYLGDGVSVRDFQVTENGVLVDMTGENQSIQNQVKRGDIEGVKVGGKKHKRLAGVSFEIRSKTTGESHIIVTDENGQFSTSADWTPHTQNTNKGSSHEDGIWFGEGKADNTKGALPYDTYLITELAGEANESYVLIPEFEISVYRNRWVINLGTLVDEEPEIPEEPEEPEEPKKPEIFIHTTASNKPDGSKAVIADGEITIIDAVEIDGLESGRSYQLHGWEMLKEEGKELVIDGKPVETNIIFTAEEERQKKEIEFTFPADKLGGSEVVIFEELYDVTEPEQPKLVAEHKDIENRSQTVSIKEKEEIKEEPEEEPKKEKKKKVKKEKKTKEKSKSVPLKAEKTRSAPKTGDRGGRTLFLFILLLVLSCTAIISCVTIMRKNK